MGEFADNDEKALQRSAQGAGGYRGNPWRKNLEPVRLDDLFVDGRTAKQRHRQSFCGNVLIENRNGLVVDAEWRQATGTAERDAATAMAENIGHTERVMMMAADKDYDTKDFVAALRSLNVTPHVARNEKRRGGSTIDGRTTRHEGYQISQRKRKRIEEVFGWMKTVGMMRMTRHRGVFWVGWMFTFAAAAYNLVRMRTLLPSAVQTA